MNKGERETANRTELLNKVIIRMFNKMNAYRYQGILEEVTIKQKEMKEKVIKKYLIRRIRKILESTYCSRNLNILQRITELQDRGTTKQEN